MEKRREGKDYIALIDKTLDRLKSAGEENQRMLSELAEQQKVLADAKRSLQGYKTKMDSAYERLEEAQAETYQTRRSLLKKLRGSFVFLFIFLGIFFLQLNITGNAIADMTTKTTSFLGVGLILVGLVAGFFWIKSKKRNPVVKKKSKK